MYTKQSVKSELFFPTTFITFSCIGRGDYIVLLVSPVSNDFSVQTVPVKSILWQLYIEKGSMGSGNICQKNTKMSENDCNIKLLGQLIVTKITYTNFSTSLHSMNECTLMSCISQSLLLMESKPQTFTVKLTCLHFSWYISCKRSTSAFLSSVIWSVCVSSELYLRKNLCKNYTYACNATRKMQCWFLLLLWLFPIRLP